MNSHKHNLLPSAPLFFQIMNSFFLDHWELLFAYVLRYYASLWSTQRHDCYYETRENVSASNRYSISGNKTADRVHTCFVQQIALENLSVCTRVVPYLPVECGETCAFQSRDWELVRGRALPREVSRVRKSWGGFTTWPMFLFLPSLLLLVPYARTCVCTYIGWFYVKKHVESIKQNMFIPKTELINLLSIPELGLLRTRHDRMIDKRLFYM